jgi:large subunit ribosomal protein L20
MARVKRGVTSHAKHKKVYKAAKGFYGRRKNTIRAAKQAVEKAGQYAFRDRKRKKRTFRALWIQRLNAAVRPFGLTYSRFIDGLSKSGVDPRAGGVPGDRREGQGRTRSLTFGLQRLPGIALGDLRPAERRERDVHGAGLVPVFPVADAHLAGVSRLLRRLQTGEEIALAFLLHGLAQLAITARAECAVLEQIHRALAARCFVDGIDDLVDGHGFVETNRGNRRSRGNRTKDGKDSHAWSQTHRVLLLWFILGQDASEKGSKSAGSSSLI